jgi:hypothetical protein
MIQPSIGERSNLSRIAPIGLITIDWQVRPSGFRVDCPQPLPWDYFRVARHPPLIGSKPDENFLYPHMWV